MPDTEKSIATGYLDGKRGYAIKLRPDDPAPEGAIAINRTTLAHFKYESMKGKPFSEIWPVYGSYYVAACSWISGAILTYNLRFRLRLFSKGRIICYGVAVGSPSIMAGVWHDWVSSTPISKGQTTHCSLCIPTRAACYNIIFGWLVPSCMTLFATQHLARTLYTYRLPLLSDHKALFQALNKVTYKLRPLIGVTFLFSAWVPFALSILEQKTIEEESISISDYQGYIQHMKEGSATKATDKDKWGNASEMQHMREGSATKATGKDEWGNAGES